MQYSSPDARYVILPLNSDYTKEHIGRFIEIAADIPKEGWTEQNYLYDLPHKWEYSIAAIETTSDRVAGFIIASRKIAAIHIHKYAIHPEQRSKGLGTYLLRHFEKNIKEKSSGFAISLYVDEHNEGAKRFYQNNGFEAVEKEGSMVLYKKLLRVIVGIHQPNFIPWLGFFNKIAQCDKFIILDHVKNKPGDGIYTKRVTIICNNSPLWLTIPLQQPKEKLFIPINEMQISKKTDIAGKHLKTIEMNYKKTPFYREFFYLFEQFYHHPSSLIAERNIDLIKEICNLLQLSTPLFRSSDYHLSTSSNELLINLIKEVKGNVYLHGSYAISEKGYQDNELFSENGIDLLLQQFKHPVYHQHNNKGAFIAGATIVDAFMNIGRERVSEMIKSDSAA